MPRTGDTYKLPAGGAVAGTEAKAVDVTAPLADLAAEQNLVRPISAGGTGASTTSAARAALGLAIGSNVQAYDAGLASVAGLTTAADKMIYTTAADTYAVTDLTSFARTILDDADAAAVLTTLGLVIGTDVQAHDASLDDLAGITFAAGDILYHDGTNLQKLTKGVDDEVLSVKSGVLAWAAGGGVDVQTFTASGTWTKPASGTIALVEAWGGGGSGSMNSNGGGGGGGGGYSFGYFLVANLGSTETVTIGAGGAGATSVTGNSGGTTSFGSLVNAYGGGGGALGGGGGGGALSGGASSGAGGLPADASTGGGAGGTASTDGTSAVFGGGGGGGREDKNGGDSVFGGGGGGGNISGGGVGQGGIGQRSGGNGGNGGTSSTVQAGTAPGGGGGGSISGTSGAGGDGFLRVTVF